MRVQVQQFAKETHSSVQHATGRAGCAGSITEHLGTRTCLSAGSSRFVAVSTTCPNAVFPRSYGQTVLVGVCVCVCVLCVQCDILKFCDENIVTGEMPNAMWQWTGKR